MEYKNYCKQLENALREKDVMIRKSHNKLELCRQMRYNVDEALNLYDKICLLNDNYSLQEKELISITISNCKDIIDSIMRVDEI